MKRALLFVFLPLATWAMAWNDNGSWSKASAADDGAVPAQSDAIELQQCFLNPVKTARLATDRPGVLALVEPKEGDFVREGHVVVRLMDEVPRAALEVAKRVADDPIEVEYATKLNEVDAAEYAKALEANQQHRKTVPEIELRRLKLAAERSLLQIDKAHHEIEVNTLKMKQSEAELNTCRIKAPFDGIVTRIEKHPGEAVRQGDSILEIVNPDVVRVEGDVSATDVWRVKLGAPVVVRLNVKNADLEVGKRVFRGRVGFVDVVSNKADGATRVWAEVPNPDNILRPGMMATMTILPSSPAAAAPKTSPAPLRTSRVPDAGFRRRATAR